MRAITVTDEKRIANCVDKRKNIFARKVQKPCIVKSYRFKMIDRFCLDKRSIIQKNATQEH